MQSFITLNYLIEIFFYKVNTNSIGVHEFTFYNNPNNVREALLRELFGETSIQSVI